MHAHGCMRESERETVEKASYRLSKRQSQKQGTGQREFVRELVDVCIHNFLRRKGTSYLSATAVTNIRMECSEHISSFIGVTAHAPLAGVNSLVNDIIVLAHLRMCTRV